MACYARLVAIAPPDTPERLVFGDFELNVTSYELIHRGRRVPLERQPMDLLILLVEGRGRLVPRTEIVRRLWAENVFVEVDTAVHTAIHKIRRALQDSPSAPRFVETVSGRGYRFVAPVETRSMVDGRASDVRPLKPLSPMNADDNVRIVELREVYWRRHAALTRNLVLQVVFVVCGGLVISQGTTRVTLVISGTPLSTTWLCFVLPVVLLYLWLEFGFVLDDLIKSRSRAWRALSRMQATARGSTFNDGLFMDGWFMCFRPTEHVIDTAFRLGSGSLFALMYLPLFALNHAFTVRLFMLGAERVPTTAEHAWVLRSLLQGLPWAAAAVIGFSHVQFRIGGRNPNWAQPAVFGLALVLLYVLSVGL